MKPGSVAVAIDGSPASEAALRHALGVARERGKPLTGIFVFDTGWADFIGNDWQSAAGARQGFLDYVRGQIETQADLARLQFIEATDGVAEAAFEVIPGDPLDALTEMMAGGEADMLVAGREVFQVCGRPSVKRLAKELPRRVRQPVVIV
jgi:nucleotide-binding universal stress UspA family protein